VSAPDKRAAAGDLPVTAGRRTADGRLVYRMVAPLVIWWGWVAVALFGLGDLAVQGHDLLSLRFGLGVLTVTGVVYACTLWPRVLAGESGIEVLNPLRRFHIPWSAVNGIFLGDSVEVQCARPAPQKDKTVYSWALSSPRRARARAQLRGLRWDRGSGSRPASYDRLPEPARQMAKAQPAEVFARELARMAEEAKARAAAGAGAGAAGAGAAVSAAGQRPETLTARWAWQPLAAIVAPGIALAIAQLIR